jgi:hypothetical protein
MVLLTCLPMRHKHQINYKEKKLPNYFDLSFILNKNNVSKKLFKQYNWLAVDVKEKICKRNCSFNNQDFNIRKRKK